MTPDLDELTRDCYLQIVISPTVLDDPAYYRRARALVARLLVGGLDDTLSNAMSVEERSRTHLVYEQLKRRLSAGE